MHIDVAVSGETQHPLDDRPLGELLPATPSTRTQDDLRDLVLAGEVHQCPGGFFLVEHMPLSTQVVRQIVQDVERIHRTATGLIGGDDMHGMEIRLRPGRDARRPADHGVGAMGAGDGYEDPLARLPDRVRMPVTEIGEELLLGLVGYESKSQLAQRHQVLGSEEMGQRVGDLLGGIDVAVDHPPTKGLGRRVDELQLVGSAHDPIRDPLAHPGAGHALDGVSNALEVLDVDRGDHRDPGVDELDDVLPPLLVAPRPRDVGMGELVDEGQLRLPGQDGVDVQLLELRSAVGDDLAGDHFEVSDQFSGPRASVGLDEPDDDVRPSAVTAPTLVEHGEGLPDAGRGPHIDTKLARGPDGVGFQLFAVIGRTRCGHAPIVPGSRVGGTKPRAGIVGDEGQKVEHMGRWRRSAVGSVATLAVMAPLVAVMIPLRGHLSIATTGLVLVVPVVIGVVVGGFRAGVFGVVAGFLVYDLVFIPPYFRLTVGANENWVVLVVYVAVMLLVASVVDRLEKARTEAHQHEEAIRRLFELTDLLIEDRPLSEILELIVSTVHQAFALRSVALLLPVDAKLDVVASAGEPLSEAELRAVAPEPGVPASLGSSVPARREQTQTVALTATGRPIGLLHIWGPGLSRHDQDLLHTFANQMALALERAQLREQALRTELLEEVDRLQRALVSAVSHDLRTPLATIKASASTLRSAHAEVTRTDREELLELIDNQTDRLDRLVTNLLDLSRVQAGALELRNEPIAVDDLVTDAIRGLGTRTDVCDITTAVDDELPLVDVDHLLIGQVLANLLDNAIRHAPPHTPVIGVGATSRRRAGPDVRGRQGPRAWLEPSGPTSSGCLTAAGRRGGPGSACRSPRHLSRPTARRSGSRTRPRGALASASPCRRLVSPWTWPDGDGPRRR